MAARLRVPDHYDLVEEDVFELYRLGVVEANDPYRYNWRVECDKGAIFRRKYAYTPQPGDAGVYPLTMTLEDDDGHILDRKTVELRVRAVPETVKPADILCVGDSLTSGGIWVEELYRRLAGTGGEPTGLGLDLRFWGNMTSAGGIAHEGYGGWTFQSFNTDYDSARFWHVRGTHALTALDQHAVYKAADGGLWRVESVGEALKLVHMGGSVAAAPEGTLVWESGGSGNAPTITVESARRATGNPFWNEQAGCVDFLDWARRVGAPKIDCCLILLGWNSTWTPVPEYYEQVRTFLGNLRAAWPDCKVLLMGLQVPEIDGFGQSYGCMWNYMDKARYVFDMDERYARIAASERGVYAASLAGQFDTEYNMPHGEFPANPRNPRPVERGINGVHPAKEGYLQIADAFYRAVLPVLMET